MKRLHPRQCGAFTLVEIMIVIAIIGLLCAIAIPNFLRARANSQSAACINNMRQLSGASDQWALEHQQTTGSAVAIANLLPYIKLNSAGSLPACPANGNYSVSYVGTNPVCSIGTTANPPHVMP